MASEESAIIAANFHTPMKHCPECNKNYADPTLSFCLQDGAPLIFGPAIEEPETALLSETSGRRDDLTEALGNPTEQANVSRGLAKETLPGLGHRNRNLTMGAIAIAIVFVCAFVGYRYLAAAGSQQISSIAVMPFVNDSQNPELEYLTDGMTETLMNSLSQLNGLNVKARSSVFRYKGKEADVQTIGKELGVQAILNGRVVKRGENLTLFLELVDASTGNRTWGEQYTEPVTNLISLQNHIAKDVSQKLSIKMSGTDQKKLGKNYTANAEAYQLYLQGRFFLNKRTPEAFRNAIPLFEQAIAMDPNYALAITGLSDSYALLANYPGGLPPKEAMPKAKDAALKALELDNELAEAHESLAHVLDQHEFNWAAAEGEYKRAIALNPNLASAHQWYSELLTALGRHDEALAETQRAIDLDPLSLIINLVKGRNLLLAGRVDDAIDQLKRAIALDPSFPAVHAVLADAYQIKGSYAESVEEFARQAELAGERDTAELARQAFAKGGWNGYLKAMTDPSHRSQFLEPFTRSIFYGALGDRDAMIRELQTAYEDRNGSMSFIKVDPRFSSVREDPRFKELYAKVGLP